MNSDGSGETPILSAGEQPAWSPLGNRIAFGSWLYWCVDGFPCLSLMNPDGSGQTNLNVTVDPAGYSWTLAWSPDATKIAFVDYSQTDCGYSTIGSLYTVNADGSGRTVLYHDCTVGSPEDPSWSPDGTKIAFGINTLGACGIYTINADGTNLSRITTPNCSYTVESHPSWSADGQEIIFESDRNNSTGVFTIYSVNPVSYGVTLLNSSVSTVRANPDCRRCGRFDRF